MHSLYRRIFYTQAVMVLLSFLLMAGIFTLAGRMVVLNNTRDSMAENAEEVGRMVRAFSEDGDMRNLDLHIALTSIAASTQRHIFLTDTEGLILNCSDRELICRHMGLYLPGGVTEALLTGGEPGLLTDLDHFFTEPRYVVATPLALEGSSTVTGFVFVTQTLSDTLSVWNLLLPLFILIGSATLLVSLGMSYGFSRYFTMPLKKMVAAARAFGHGDFSVRLEDTDRDDEIGELAEAFNTMADSLAKSETRRSEFIANVSHELKTPMTTISGFADGIMDGTIPPEMQNHYLEIISTETKRLARLVRSMLELSRLQADDRSTLLSKSFDIAEVLRLTLLNFTDKLESKKMDVDFRVPDGRMTVVGDVDAITQVVYNLMDNAIKFAPDGSELGISLWKENSKAFVSVRNHGKTIPDAEIPLIFDRFHKGDRSRSRNRDGAGLGLYIVKTILNNHGEDIAVTSRAGVTDFVFSLTPKEK